MKPLGEVISRLRNFILYVQKFNLQTFLQNFVALVLLRIVIIFKDSQDNLLALGAVRRAILAALGQKSHDIIQKRLRAPG